MKAVIFREFGGPEVLHVAELPDPVPGPEDVVVRVTAATVNPTDLMMRSGVQADRMRDLVPPYICGQEFSGHVHAVGSPSTRLSPGLRVMGIVHPRRPQGGAYAELVCVPQASVVQVPDSLDLVDAATIPMNGMTARVALETLALRPGQALLVTGGAGSLGGYVIQIASNAGIVVVADAKDEDRDLLHRLGTRHVVARGPQMAAAVRALYPDGVDALVDCALLGDEAAPLVRASGGIASVRTAQKFATPGRTVSHVGVMEQIRNTDWLTALAAQARRNVITPRVARRLPMTQAAEAHRIVERGGLRGRMVLTF